MYEVMSCTSPIARSVDDLAFLFKSMLCPELWAKDQDVAPIPFNDQVGLIHYRGDPLRILFAHFGHEHMNAYYTSAVYNVYNMEAKLHG